MYTHIYLRYNEIILLFTETSLENGKNIFQKTNIYVVVHIIPLDH